MGNTHEQQMLKPSQNDAATAGREVMEWFSKKTSIAGYQIPSWALVLGAIIVIWLIYEFIT
jgi:hypothetical protein